MARSCSLGAAELQGTASWCRMMGWETWGPHDAPTGLPEIQNTCQVKAGAREGVLAHLRSQVPAQSPIPEAFGQTAARSMSLFHLGAC